MIEFFNTLSGKKEKFVPLSAEKGKTKDVGIYACGPTVYDFAHIGNFRTFIFGDLLRRFLESEGFKVKHVMNITDVDDKTIAGAKAEHTELKEFTDKYTDAFHEDLETLNILKPNFPPEQPRATLEIPCMLELVAKLVKNGAAYESEGSVYFSIAKFQNYGKLSKKKLEMNIGGARVDSDTYEKEDGADFVLWKKAKEGEPSWESPWGRGRPGWHLECAAMSMKYLGETFDIHLGGEDLIFPHHENEIAQSEAATLKPFVRYWLHCRFLLVDGRKMSKSAGNFYTLRDLIKKGADPRALRYALLATHYRVPLNFTLDGLGAAKKALEDINTFYSSVINHDKWGRSFSPDDRAGGLIDDLIRDFRQALSDDLNVSKALGVFHTFIGKIDAKVKRGELSKDEWKKLCDVLKTINGILGVVRNQDFEKFPQHVKDAKREREQLRAQKKFQETDKQRKEYDEKGFRFWDESSGVSGVAQIK